MQHQEQPKKEVPLLKFESNSRGASASAKRRDLSGAAAGFMSSGVRKGLNDSGGVAAHVWGASLKRCR